MVLTRQIANAVLALYCLPEPPSWIHISVIEDELDRQAKKLRTSQVHPSISNIGFAWPTRDYEQS